VHPPAHSILLLKRLDHPQHLTHTNNLRTDKYLDLCLAQATKSPLRYRHGAVIVRGGKVIDQGYNDYRSGFDGGALKTGALSLRSPGSLTIAELKEKNSIKR
jgi:hypothetical protein